MADIDPNLNNLIRRSGEEDGAFLAPLLPMVNNRYIFTGGASLPMKTFIDVIFAPYKKC